MHIRSWLSSAGLVAVLCASSAHAVLMEYRLTGGGLFTINGGGYPPQIYRLTLSADTDDIFIDPDTGVSEVVGSAIIDLGPGPGVAQFLSATRIRLSPGESLLTFGEAGGPGLISLFDPALASATLDGPFGPVTDGNPAQFDNFTNIPTSLGSLTLRYYAAGVTFESVVVPSPSAALMVGALPIMAHRRRRRVRSTEHTGSFS